MTYNKSFVQFQRIKSCEIEKKTDIHWLSVILFSRKEQKTIWKQWQELTAQQFQETRVNYCGYTWEVWVHRRTNIGDSIHWNNKIHICNIFIVIFLKGFVCPFSSKSTDKIGESPRLREFRKKLRERAPMGTLPHAIARSNFSWISKI